MMLSVAGKYQNVLLIGILALVFVTSHVLHYLGAGMPARRVASLLAQPAGAQLEALQSSQALS